MQKLYDEGEPELGIKVVYIPSPTIAEQLSKAILYNHTMPFIKLEWHISRELKNHIGLWYLFMAHNNTYPTTKESLNYPII